MDSLFVRSAVLRILFIRLAFSSITEASSGFVAEKSASQSHANTAATLTLKLLEPYLGGPGYSDHPVGFSKSLEEI